MILLSFFFSIIDSIEGAEFHFDSPLSEGDDGIHAEKDDDSTDLLSK